MRILLKESFISIKRNFKRFVSILLIILLGVGFFAGIKATSPNMKKTLNKYYEDNNFMDFDLISTWGIADEDIEVLKKEGYSVEATYQFDSIVKGETEEVIKIMSYDPNISINKPVLLEGRFPVKDNECVIEKNQYTDSHQIGDEITVDNNNLKQKNLIVVGIIKSPIYSSLERGSTNLLSGKINFFMYIPVTNFDVDYYTNIAVDLKIENDTFSDDYQKTIKKEEKRLEKILSNLKEKRYIKEKENATKELNNQIKKLNEEKRKYNNEIKKAQEAIIDAKNTYQKNLNNLNNQELQTKKNFSEIDSKLNNATQKLILQEKELFLAEQQLNSKNLELTNHLKELEAKYQTISDDLVIVKTNITELEKKKNILEDLINSNIDVEINTQLLNETIKNIEKTNVNKEQLENNLITLNTTIMNIKNGIELSKKELEKNKNILIKSKNDLANQKKEMDKNKEQIYNQINNAKKQLQIAYETININEKKLNSKVIEATTKFEDVEKQITLAEKEINNLEYPTWYILNRDKNLGFYQYSQDTERINNIGKVFPLVFFVVAILICLTSMTRMIEEERNQLGTLKALGYNNVEIVLKYIIYVLLAAIIGSFIGLCIGFRIIPSVIFNMYTMVYNIGDMVLEFNIKYALLGTILALSCTLFATLLACYHELKESPASLMRPKAPTVGKRVLLERITFIWKHLSFSRKVTIRNVFRYKKRFMMTILGIAGCTSLIIAGFGLQDCISGMVPNQYGKVFDYQIELTFKDDIDLKTKNSEVERIKKINKVKKVLVANKESVELLNKNTNQTIQLIVPFEDPRGLINLTNRETNYQYNIDEVGKVIITEKISNLLNLKVGDELKFKTTDKKDYTVEISAIAENYFNHYFYMNQETYDTNNYNTLLIKTDSLTEEEEKELANIIKKEDNVANISFTSSMRSIFDSTMKNFKYVAGVLIVSAGLLAFVVLYNLASVNISERRRELATIKVLGFYDKEVHNYIGRETTILTVIGMIIGIFVGKILTIFIIKTCEIDSIMFNTVISLNSYIYSLIITAIFTILVNITTYFALKKIDMIESLKSVE